MSSSVYFKFKSQKEPTRVEFDGTGISVFELKRDIIIKSGLGDGTDFDLAIYTEDGKEEYDDDTTIIPRSTTVVARRLPPMKPGAGRAARYVSGKMPVNAKNASRREQTAKTTAKNTSNAIEQMHNAMTEDEKLAAMFAAQSEQWNAQQEEMSHQTPIFKPGSRRPANVPDHDPPNGYICYRCGEKGHWIQLCPTNDNPEFDNRPRVKRTTGIPRSFLKTVDKAAVLAQAAEDDTKAPSGIMVNADGDFVIAEPDKASWEKFQAKTKSGAAAQEVAALGDKELQERGLECPIDKKLLIDPMKTPCCEKTYCNDCITYALIESDFVCPGCQSEGILIDDLKPDEEAEEKVRTYQKEKEAAAGQKKVADEEASSKDASTTSPKTAQATATDANKTADTASANGDGKSPADARQGSQAPADSSQNAGADGASGAAAANPKKRPADTEAVNPKIPKAPKAMQQQQQQQQMNEMAGFGMDMSAMGMNMGMNGMMGNMGNMGMMPYGGMPMMGFGMNGMGNMGNMGNMNMGNMNMMNPMMGMNGMNGMTGGGYGYNTGGGYNNNGGYRGGNNYQQGWNNGNRGGYNGGYNNRYNNHNNYPNQGHNGHNGGYNNHQNGQNGAAGQNNNGNGNGNNQNNIQATANNSDGADDDAYFRKPVNPTRHFNKPKRVRPSDYREL